MKKKKEISTFWGGLFGFTIGAGIVFIYSADTLWKLMFGIPGVCVICEVSPIIYLWYILILIGSSLIGWGIHSLIRRIRK